MRSGLAARWSPRCWPLCRSRSVAKQATPPACPAGADHLERVDRGRRGERDVRDGGADAERVDAGCRQRVGRPARQSRGFPSVRRRGGVTVSLQAPAEVTVGIAYDISVVVRNTGRRPTAPLRIRYEVPIAPTPVAPAVVYVDPVAPGETALMSVTRIPLRRGAVQTSRLYVDAIGSFGFFTSSERVDAPPALLRSPGRSRADRLSRER